MQSIAIFLVQMAPQNDIPPIPWCLFGQWLVYRSFYSFSVEIHSVSWHVSCLPVCLINCQPPGSCHVYSRNVAIPCPSFPFGQFCQKNYLSLSQINKVTLSKQDRQSNSITSMSPWSIVTLPIHIEQVDIPTLCPLQ